MIYKTKKINNRPNNLFIIFGTTRGLGSAVAKLLSSHKDNLIIAVNRKIYSDNTENIIQVKTDLSKQIKKTDLGRIFNSLSGNISYKKIYLINNASTIDPIGFIGSVDNESLIKSININFLNYTILLN